MDVITATGTNGSIAGERQATEKRVAAQLANVRELVDLAQSIRQDLPGLDPTATLAELARALKGGIEGAFQVYQEHLAGTAAEKQGGAGSAAAEPLLDEIQAAQAKRQQTAAALPKLEGSIERSVHKAMAQLAECVEWLKGRENAAGWEALDYLQGQVGELAAGQARQLGEQVRARMESYPLNRRDAREGIMDCGELLAKACWLSRRAAAELPGSGS
jgi:hypothetical protein